MIGELIRVRYEILEEIARTPIFHTFGARDRLRNVEVCVRLVNEPFASEPGFVEALQRVVARCSSLEHPNVARVYEMDEHNGRPFVVTEWIKGTPLSVRIRRLAPMTPSAVCEIGIGICEGLAYAVSAGVVHGDLSAEHVITTLDGRVALINFGMYEAYAGSETAGGVVISRLAPYLAPEVISGGAPTESSDVYAVGVLLFELLTGTHPFSAPTAGAILAKHQLESPPLPRKLNPAIPPALEMIVLRALAKSPEERYSTASALLSDLRKLLDALRFGKRLDADLVEFGKGSGETREPVGEKRQERRLGAMVHQQSYRGKPEVARPKSPPSRRSIEAYQDDVPWWVKAVVYMFVGMLVFGVGGYVYFNLTKARKVEVPQLIGLPYAQARKTAEQVNLELIIVGEEPSERYPQPRTVVWVDPAPGTPVREGSLIRVKLSAGSRTVEVPDVRGLGVAEARSRLEAVDLRVDPNLRWVRSREVGYGMVINTEPGVRERVDRGTVITLVVSSGREPSGEPPVDPSEMVANTWRLSFIVEGKEGEEGKEVMVRVEMTDATRKKRVIYEGLRTVGEEVILENIEGYGKEALFRIYVDNYLSKTVRQAGESG